MHLEKLLEEAWSTMPLREWDKGAGIMGMTDGNLFSREIYRITEFQAGYPSGGKRLPAQKLRIGIANGEYLNALLKENFWSSPIKG